MFGSELSLLIQQVVLEVAVVFVTSVAQKFFAGHASPDRFSPSLDERVTQVTAMCLLCSSCRVVLEELKLG